jgi:hypothetical protein
MTFLRVRVKRRRGNSSLMGMLERYTFSEHTGNGKRVPKQRASRG